MNLLVVLPYIYLHKIEGCLYYLIKNYNIELLDVFVKEILYCSTPIVVEINSLHFQ